jgi:hypothetical protein
MPGTSNAYFVIPTTEAPAQSVNVTLNGQPCSISLYTKSINVPIEQQMPTDPDPVYQNTNPCFIDFYVAGILVIGGVLVRQGSLIVRDTYLYTDQGLPVLGDLSVIDTSGAGEDPQGMPYRLPYPELRNQLQQSIPLSYGGVAPPSMAGRIVGMGSRWLLTFWNPGTYQPGYSLPP